MKHLVELRKAKHHVMQVTVVAGGPPRGGIIKFNL